MSAQRCDAHFGTSDRRCMRPAGHSQPLHTIPGDISWPDSLVMRRTSTARRRSGELFAGVGGLGMAVDEVFDAEPAWFCEFDAAPSKVLAHHFPEVPNFGDVRAVDWAKVEHPSILAGGFPCQDVSLAGARRGMRDGTRSGLWSEFAKAIDQIRPDWVVIENVRGLLSADAAVDVEPCPLCVGDNPEHVLRALGAVLGDLADLGFDAEWTGIRASDIGAPHGRFRVFILAWPREATRDAEGSGGRLGIGSRETGREGGEVAREAWPAVRGFAGGADCEADRRAVKLLSTPDTVPEAPNTGSNSHKAGNIVGLGNQVMSLLPTPRTTDMNGAGAHGDGGLDLRTTVTLLPTPVAQPSGNTPQDRLRKKPGREVVTDLAIIAENGLIESGGRLLPTPAASLGEHRRDYGQPPEARRAGGHSVSTADAARGLTDAGVGWGPYSAAIERWEAVADRPAPAPVRFDGKGGKPRLNPELTEWMMGWPAGHVTDPEIGLSRAEQLKACGNGVVPQQAAAAIREMLARPGVPALDVMAVAS